MNPALLFEAPLWWDLDVPWLNAFEMISLDALNSQAWAFWQLNWYHGFKSGRPIDSGLQKQIALIPGLDWRKGPDHIADLINQITSDWMREQSPYATQIKVEAERQALVAVPAGAENVSLYQTALKRVRYMMDQMRDGNGLPQHFSGCARVFRRLDDAYDMFTDDPQWMHDEFLLSAKQIGRLVESGEVQEDEDVDALRSALVTASDDIRAADADVRASVTARVKLRIDEMRVEDTDGIAEALEAVGEVSEGLLTNEVEATAEILRAISAEGDAPALGGVSHDEKIDAIYRSAALSARAYPKLGQLSDMLNAAGDAVERATKVVAAIKLVGRAMILLLAYLAGGG